MERQILVQCEEQETKVAIIEDSEVVELFIDREQEEKIVGNMYLAKVDKVMQNLDAAFVDIGLDKSAYLPFTEVRQRDKAGKVMLKKNEKILVQIIKGAISTKGARCTTQISIPGRYLVYKPYELKKHIGISKSIVDKQERMRLRAILKNVSIEAGGFIVRTEGAGIEEKVFNREVAYLIELWAKIEKNMEGKSAPNLIHKEFGIVFKIARDKMTQDVVSFIIDSQELFQSVKSFVKMISPNYVKKITQHKGKTTIFDSCGVQKVLDNITKQRIYLPSGGYIIIQEAESLCAIDVNSGRTKGVNLEETILKTNLESVKEIVVQLRLRNIGGIIVIDFVDMEKKAHRDLLLNKLKESVKYDKARIKILPITALGLIEMTRQRKTESVLSFLSDNCPYCYGTGKISSKETLYFKIRKELKDMSEKLFGRKIKLTMNPKFKEYFTKYRIKRLKENLDLDLKISFDHKVSMNDYELIID